jgi:hypothetical protein
MYCYTRYVTSELMGFGSQGDAPTALPPGRRAGARCIVGCVDARAGLPQFKLHRRNYKYLYVQF